MASEAVVADHPTSSEVMEEVHEDKLVQTPVVEEAEDTIEALAVEEKISTETTVVEDKLVQTPVVEVAKDTIEQLVVEENTTTETPVIEEVKITVEPPVVEEKIVIEPLPVEEKLVHTSVVKAAEETIEPIVMKEEILTETLVVEEKIVETPVVEENDVIEASIVEEEIIVTEPSVVEASNHISETFVFEQVKTAFHTPDVVSVKNESIVGQDCAAEPDTPDVSELEAKIVETKLVADISESPEAEEAKVEFVEVKLREKEKTVDIPKLSTQIVDNKDVEIPELEPIKEEVDETSTVVVDKPQEYVLVETKKSVEVPKQEEDHTDAKEEISAGKADLVEELPKQEARTLVKLEAETKVKDVNAEDCSHPETIEPEELVAENGNEDKKSAVETCSNGTLEDKTSEKPDDNKLEKPDAEAKGEDNVPTHETKDLDDKVTLQDPPKELVTIKSTQKQSNTILSKMKKTLVKAKKAITGKSTNGKTPSSEPKGEIKI